MNTLLKSIVGWLLLLSALVFYTYGIWHAVALSWSGEEIGDKDYPETLLTIISSIQAMLLANLGVILGISVAKPQSILAQSVLFNSKKQDITVQAAPDPISIKEQIQLVGVVIYIISLIVCVITWVHSGWTTDSKKAISIIPQSGQMFFGVVLAYLTAIFSKNTP